MYPALSVLKRLSSDEERRMEEDIRPSYIDNRHTEILWVGREGGMETDLVKREDVPFVAIPAAGVHGVGWRAMPGNLLQLGRGFTASRRILRQFRPEVLFFTGGYVAVPMAMAARFPRLGFRRPAILLYVPDIEPGLALKLLARFADRITVTVEDSRAYFSKHATVTGYPTRQGLGAWGLEQARQTLNLRTDLPCLLVIGGSTGARSLNKALLDILPDLLSEMQVVHLSGRLDWSEVENAHKVLPPEKAARYHPYPYLHEEIGAALSAADLVISRAGASTLGEYPLFALPAILVPYPYAWRYQQTNARYLERRGSAIIVEDSELPMKLLPTIQSLMRDKGRREQMRQAMQGLNHPQAAESIAIILKRLATTPQQTKAVIHG